MLNFAVSYRRLRNVAPIVNGVCTQLHQRYRYQVQNQSIHRWEVRKFIFNSLALARVTSCDTNRSFVVIHTNLSPGDKSKHELHKVWYDIVYDFDDGRRFEDSGVYFGE